MEEVMMFRYMPALLIALGSAAWAQQTPPLPPASLSGQGETRALNDQAAVQAQGSMTAEQGRQDQYDRDRAAFRAEVAARKAKIADDQAAYARQQAAYADAMAEWRRQSEACKAGDQAACKAKTPAPADFLTP